MKTLISASIILLLTGFSCRQLNPEFSNDGPVGLYCLDTLELMTKKTAFHKVRLVTANRWVAGIEGDVSIRGVFPGMTKVFLADQKTGARYDSVDVIVRRPEGQAPVNELFVKFGACVEDVLKFETEACGKPELKKVSDKETGVKYTSVKALRPFYDNPSRGVYYHFDENDRLRQIVVPFIFAMVREDAEKFTRYMLSQGAPVAELGGFKVALLYSGESESDYLSATEALRKGEVDNPVVAGKVAICYAFSQSVEPAIIYFPAKDLYDFPRYSYDFW